MPGSSCLGPRYLSHTLGMVISVQVSYYRRQQCIPASAEGHSEILCTNAQRQSRNDLESRPKPSAQLWHRLRTTGQENRHRGGKTANFSPCSSPTGLLVPFSTELAIPALTNTPGAHCCGPALHQGSCRRAMARGAAQISTAPSAGSPGRSRHLISCCSSPGRAGSQQSCQTL